MAKFLLNTLLISFVETLYLVGVFIAIGFILGFMEKQSNTCLVRTFGRKGVMLTAWIGTPIHEIGHFIQCLIWGHKVTKMKLLQTNSSDGVLGYVEHRYNPDSIYQRVGNFFIGLGPIFSGGGSLILGMYLLVPQTYDTLIFQIHQHISVEMLNVDVLKAIGGVVVAIIKSLFTLHNLLTPSFWLYILLAISISSHIALSKADIQNSVSGLVMIFFLLMLFNTASDFLHLNSSKMIVQLGEYNAYVLAFSSIAVLFSFVTLVLSFLVYMLKNKIIKH